MSGDPVRPSQLEWYALCVRARHERIAWSVLQNKGYETYLPLYRSRRKWSDRITELELPLFPGYVFCRFDPSDRRVPILTTPGVQHIVGAGRSPLPVDESELAAVRAVIASGLAAEPWPYLKAGHRVRIDAGALEGLEGILVEVKKHHRLVISVTLLQRSVAVEIDRTWVSPVAPVLRARPA